MKAPILRCRKDREAMVTGSPLTGNLSHAGGHLSETFFFITNRISYVVAAQLPTTLEETLRFV